MKAIPKEELIELLKKISNKILYQDDMEEFFNIYGDEYFCSREGGCMELINKSTKRKEVLNNE